METYFTFKAAEEIIGMSVFFLVIIGLASSVILDKISLHKKKRKK